MRCSCSFSERTRLRPSSELYAGGLPQVTPSTSGIVEAPGRRPVQAIESTTPPSTRSAAPVVAEACGEQV